MKKIALLFAVVAFITPNFVLAAWWNPLSWFKRTNTKTEVLEKRIQEFEAKINDTASTTKSNTGTSSVQTKSKIVPIINNSNTKEDTEIKLQQQIFEAKQRIETQLNIDKTNTEAQAKLQAENQARIDVIKKQQAIDRANEEARDVQLRIDAKNQLIQSIKIKIAEMNQVEVQIETYTGQALLDALTEAKNLYGDGLFTSIINKQKGAILSMSLPYPYPELKRSLDSIVRNYIAFLRVELEKNQ